MPKVSDFNRYGEELEKRLQLRTSPIAIKLLEKEKDIPEGAIRPKRDLASHLALCQAFAMARRDKKVVAMLKDDNWCSLPVLAYGIAETPELFLEGRTEFPVRIGSLEAAAKWAKRAPRLKYGKYIGVLTAPLKTANFEPDVVLIYGNSAQIKCLLDGMKYKEGYQVTSTLEPAGACIQAVVRLLQSGDCQVAVPCGGDRKWALAQDDELIFSLPKDKLEDLLVGIRHFDDELGTGYIGMTAEIGMKLEYPLLPYNAKVGRLIGLEVPEPEE